MGLVSVAAVTLDTLRYGGGVDLWNVSQLSYKQFTKVFF